MRSVWHPCEAASLGRWVGISGAAFTTGLGYRTSFAKSLLMGLFNVRLGYWWTSGLSPSERQEAEARTRPNFLNRLESMAATLLPAQTYLLQELTARFHGPALKHWYLSDGGHFENTAAYELLRRRVPFIVVCDNGCDPDYVFEDVANLVRKARLDFDAEIVFLSQAELTSLGVPLSLRELLGTPEDFHREKSEEKDGPRRTPKHALLARVSYAGRGMESRNRGAADLLHYQSEHPDFPNETTADQYFDEAQWESYRRLGFHIGSLLFQDYGGEKSRTTPYWQPRDLCPPRRSPE